MLSIQYCAAMGSSIPAVVAFKSAAPGQNESPPSLDSRLHVAGSQNPTEILALIHMLISTVIAELQPPSFL